MTESIRTNTLANLLMAFHLGPVAVSLLRLAERGTALPEPVARGRERECARLMRLGAKGPMLLTGEQGTRTRNCR